MHAILPPILLLILLLPPAAHAGPWPRAPGSSFMALARHDDTGSIWIEHGLDDDRWLSFEIMHADGLPTLGVSLHKVLHLAMAERLGLRTATSLGLRLDRPHDRWAGHVSLGLSVGRAISWPWPGWGALDLRHDQGLFRQRLKADLTLGLRPWQDWVVIVQWQHDHQILLHTREHQRSRHLQSGLLWDITPRLSLEIGMRQDLRHGGGSARIGTWIRF